MNSKFFKIWLVLSPYVKPKSLKILKLKKYQNNAAFLWFILNNSLLTISLEHRPCSVLKYSNLFFGKKKC